MIKRLTFVVSIGLLALLLYFSGLQEVLNASKDFDVLLIPGMLSITVITLALKTLKWKILLEKIGIKKDFGVLYKTLTAGIFLSSLTPGRSGEPVRAYLLKKKTGTSFSTVLPTVVADRIFDIIAVLTLVFLGTNVAPLPESLRNALWVSTALILTALFALLFVSGKKNLMLSIWGFFSRIAGKIPRLSKYSKRVPEAIERFHSGMRRFADPKTLAAMLTIAMSSWLLDFAILYTVALSMGINTSYLFTVFTLGASIIVGLASFLPGGVGSSETIASLIFSQKIDCGAALCPQATTIILIYRLFTLYFVWALGAVFLNTLQKTNTGSGINKKKNKS